MKIKILGNKKETFTRKKFVLQALRQNFVEPQPNREKFVVKDVEYV